MGGYVSMQVVKCVNVERTSKRPIKSRSAVESGKADDQKRDKHGPGSKLQPTERRYSFMRSGSETRVGKQEAYKRTV